MRRRGRGGAVVAAVLAAAGCAGAPASRPPAASGTGAGATAEAAPKAGGFPTPEELERLGEPPAPEALFDADVHAVDEWRLAGPFPELVGALPHAEPGPWGALLAEVARSRAGLVLPTEGLHCAAREIGRFLLAFGAQPEDELRQYIARRCHAAVESVGFGTVRGGVAPGEDEAAVFERFRPEARRQASRAVSGGPRSVGVWFGRADDRGVFVVAYGERRVHVEPFSPVAGPGGRVEIRGEALVPAARIEALVNRGAFGVAACESVAGVEPPGFQFACEVAPEDASARVSIALAPPLRLVSHPGLDVLVFPTEARPQVYRRPRLPGRHPATDAEDAPAAFAALLNRVRARAGLAPLELDPRQSREAAQLAPHFFSAMQGLAPDISADLVVLGMMAGWSVEGIVRSGYFAAAWTPDRRDLGDLVAAVLAGPWGRQALLADDVERIAVGPIVGSEPGRESLAVLVGTYGLFSSEGHEAFARRVRAKLAAERARLGAPAPERLDELVPLCQAAASSVEGGAEPADAVRELLRASGAALGRPVSGWVTEVRELDDVEFPREFLADPRLAAAVAVSHAKPEGEPWGRYVVMLVFAAPASFGA